MKNPEEPQDQQNVYQGINLAVDPTDLPKETVIDVDERIGAEPPKALDPEVHPFREDNVDQTNALKTRS